MTRKVTNPIELVRDGKTIASTQIEQTINGNNYLLVWDGEWVKNPPKELKDLPHSGGAQTFIEALRNIAKHHEETIEVRHPENWTAFTKSMKKIADIIGFEFRIIK